MTEHTCAKCGEPITKATWRYLGRGVYVCVPCFYAPSERFVVGKEKATRELGA